MPRVGSSKIMTFGFMASHLPSTTFCWLPPERWPARVVTCGALMPRLRRCVSATSISLERRDDEVARVGGQIGQRDILGDRQVEQQPRALAVLGHEEDAAIDGRRRIARREGLAVELEMAAIDGIDAEDGPRQLGAPGTDEAGDADDFAVAQCEIDRLPGIGRGAHARSTLRATAPGALCRRDRSAP